jgi:hypothetical protein
MAKHTAEEKAEEFKNLLQKKNDIKELVGLLNEATQELFNHPMTNPKLINKISLALIKHGVK